MRMEMMNRLHSETLPCSDVAVQTLALLPVGLALGGLNHTCTAGVIEPNPVPLLRLPCCISSLSDFYTIGFALRLGGSPLLSSSTIIANRDGQGEARCEFRERKANNESNLDSRCCDAAHHTAKEIKMKIAGGLDAHGCLSHARYGRMA